MADPLMPSLSGSLPKLPRLQIVGNQTVECAPSAADTSLANCNRLDEVLARCNTLANQNAPKQDIIDCFCTQEVLSDYVGCKNDLRLCSLSYTYDSDFDKMISDWNNACKSHLTATITTPAGVTLTQTFNELSCQTLIVSCNKLAATESSCSSAFTQATDLYNCRCGRDVLSLASECEIDGALQCLKTTPNPSMLWAARFCSMTPTIPGVNPGTGNLGTPTMPPLTTSSPTPLPTSSTSTPITTAPSISFGPDSTTISSTTSAGNASLKAPGLLAVLAWGIIITWFAR